MSDLGTLIQDIERHLDGHPSAADSVEGVAAWWLPHCTVPPPLAQVEQALAVLVQQGRLRRVTLADGSTLYGSAAAGTPWRM